MLSVFCDVIFGLIMGAMGGFFGIGGGLIAIPTMAILFDQDQTLAQGTALVMMVPNVALALWRYQQRSPIRWALALPLAGAGLLLAGVGAHMATRLDPLKIQFGFAVLMLALAGLNLIRARLVSNTTARMLATPSRLAALGSGCGLLGGFFGVGSSVVAVPVLTSVFGITQVAAQGMALCLALPSTLITLAAYGAAGHVDWVMGLAMAAGGMFSVSWGVSLAYRTPERLLCALFSGFLVACAGLLFLKG